MNETRRQNYPVKLSVRFLLKSRVYLERRCGVTLDCSGGRRPSWRPAETAPRRLPSRGARSGRASSATTPRRRSASAERGPDVGQRRVLASHSPQRRVDPAEAAPRAPRAWCGFSASPAAHGARGDAHRAPRFPSGMTATSLPASPADF